MTKEEFLTVVDWKSPRRKDLAKANSEDDVKDATQTAFSTKNARVKICVLTTLDGVGYPMASAILHLACKDVPLLDVRALATLGLEKPTSYDFRFWNDYCVAVFAIAGASKLSLRVIDRALWSYGGTILKRRATVT